MCGWVGLAVCVRPPTDPPFHVMTSALAPDNDRGIVYCKQVDGPKLANMLQNGKTPLLPPKELQEIGYTIVAYPLALLRWG